ncbi:hypothetical protein [Caballeronia sp. LZ029]|uniref:hypothetical protein n=1 Tax=Caballeronia sp. LZ029 TaxID=3038564 RepID=UPI0038574601
MLAGNGEAALSQAGRHLPDVIVTYLEMPNLHGVGLCRRLKSHAHEIMRKVACVADKYCKPQGDIDGSGTSSQSRR